MRLLLDEMWPPALAQALRERGHDVESVAERSDLRGETDQEIFDEACYTGQVIVTENVLDYRALAAAAVTSGRVYPGLIFTGNRAFPRARRRTTGRIVLALDGLLSSGDSIVGERWLV